jgi:hypothetical protein
MTKIDAEFLARIDARASNEIEIHEPSKVFPAMGPDVVIDARDIREWVKYTRHLKDTAIGLLADKQKAQDQLKETQYLSTLWIQALTDFIPPEKRKDALGEAAKLIVAGMKKAGIEEYDALSDKLES